MHRKRVIVALVLVPLLYISIMYLPSGFFLGLLVFFSTIALSEFYAMAGIKGVMKFAGLLCGASGLSVYYVARGIFPDALLLIILVIAALRLFSRRDPAASLSEVSLVLFGLFYVPGLMMVQINIFEKGPGWIIMLYVAVWMADSAAYYVGKGIGRRKLYEAISPNKTVAGAFGSVIGGSVGAVLVRVLLMGQVDVLRAVIIGALVGAATIVGDLVESMFKRDAGVKDSGSILPGHGGILDKIDGVTFAGPVFYWFCRATGLF